jgi:hypothetical protein
VSFGGDWSAIVSRVCFGCPRLDSLAGFGGCAAARIRQLERDPHVNPQVVLRFACDGCGFGGGGEAVQGIGCSFGSCGSYGSVWRWWLCRLGRSS